MIPIDVVYTSQERALLSSIIAVANPHSAISLNLQRTKQSALINPHSAIFKLPLRQKKTPLPGGSGGNGASS
jgi:hypothetical protein